MSFGSSSGRKGSQVAALASLRILLARIQTILSTFQFTNHVSPYVTPFVGQQVDSIRPHAVWLLRTSHCGEHQGRRNPAPDPRFVSSLARGGVAPHPESSVPKPIEVGAASKGRSASGHHGIAAARLTRQLDRPYPAGRYMRSLFIQIHAECIINLFGSSIGLIGMVSVDLISLIADSKA